MQQSIFHRARGLLLTFTILSLFTISAKAGGDSYAIYLNNKLILKQHVSQSLNIQSLQLDKANANDRLVIFYSHCGETGKERSIAIKDAKGKTLKEWKFKNTSGSDGSMTIAVKEILQLTKNSGQAQLNLYYAAKELPKGLMLTSLNLGKSSVTSHKRKTSCHSARYVAVVGIFGLGRFLA